MEFFKLKRSLFLDNNDGNQFLKNELQKSLSFRVLIEPYKVYSKGVTEWEALDEIKSIASPCQMLWSLIYRKLKGNRGNTMITIYESERLMYLIKTKNNNQEIVSKYFSFDLENQEIMKLQTQNLYEGRKEKINILPRLIYKYKTNKAFESHLQAYIVQNIGKGTNTNLDNLILGENSNIEWIGNEISCGVGMQRIDIGISLNISDQERIFIPIELKAVEASINNIYQMKRYMNWISQYYIPNRISEIKPFLICKRKEVKEKLFLDEMKKFKKEYNIELILIEYIVKNDNLIFTEYKYY